MKRITVALVVLLVSVQAWSASAGDREVAVDLVKKAVALYKSNGADRLLQEVRKPDGSFVSTGSFVYLQDMDGTVLAHPLDRASIGENISDRRDADGNPFIRAMQEKAKAEAASWTDYRRAIGWVEHRTADPRTHSVEARSTYYERVDGLLVCGEFPRAGMAVSQGPSARTAVASRE